MTGRLTCLLVPIVVIACTAPSAAQTARPAVKAPPAPTEYSVRLRYEIKAFRNERLVQYFALIRHLQSIGFHKDEGPENEPEDAEATRMTGTIASQRAGKLLQDRHVKSVLLFPTDAKPATDATPVRVEPAPAHGPPVRG